MKPSRPLLRYHGGKWRLASWVIEHLPPHRLYVEPFGGAASVLLQKPRSYAEIYNDLDDEVVNLFTVMRDEESARRLTALVEMTPYARREFDRAYEPAEEPIERARRLLIRSFMGHGSSGVRAHKTGFRISAGREGNTSADNWRALPAAMPAIVERLRGVVIECRPATKLLDRHDGPETLFYLDPPYVFGTRSQKRKGNDLYHGYRHELDDAGHFALLAHVQRLRGMVVLSGYPSDLYDQALAGWTRIETEALADGGRKRTEALWLNPQAMSARLPLFAAVTSTGRAGR